MSRLAIAVEALDRIANPLKYIKKEADEKGAHLNGALVLELLKSPSYYQDIAKKALEQLK